MHRGENEFWSSSFAKVAAMIDMYTDELMLKSSAMDNKPYSSKYFNQQQEEVQVIKSMKEIKGW